MVGVRNKKLVSFIKNITIVYILIIQSKKSVKIWKKENEIKFQIKKSKYFYNRIHKFKNTIKLPKETFFDFFPSKISLKKLFVKGAFPLNSKFIENLIQHAENIINSSCNPETKIIIFIISHPKNYHIRRNIRESFGNNKKKYKYENLGNKTINNYHCTIFSIGYLNDPNLNQVVDYESFIYRDILRIPIFEEYHLTVHKIILTLFLLNQVTYNFKNIIKINDDILLKINKLIPYIMGINKNEVFVGEVIKNQIPERDPKQKWYVSETEYPANVFKPFLNGACYVLNRSIINDIVEKHYSLKTIPIENIHISYLVTESGYSLSNSNYIWQCIKADCEKSYVIDIGRDSFLRKILLDKYRKEYE